VATHADQYRPLSRSLFEMQYGQLISRSLSIVWRHRYLWVLAILGGSDIGGSGFSSPTSGGNFSGLRSGGTSSTGGPSSQQVSQFLQDNLGEIVAILAIVLLLALGWFLLSCITTGALVRASAEHDADRPFRFGLAWRAGLSRFWPILGLRLLGLAVGLLVVAIIGLLVLLGFLSYNAGQSGALAAVVVVGVLFALALIPTAIVAGIVFILATRSIVLELRGTIASLGRALELVQARLWRALLVWLIQVGLSIGAGLAIAIALVVVFVILGGVVVALGFAAGVGAAIVVGIPIGLLLLALVIVAGGIINAYFSTYWTLAFRRLELDPPPVAAWVPTGYPAPPSAAT
jgi:hypothetical protein